MKATAPAANPRRGRCRRSCAQARWFSAIGDGAASNLGSGATHDGVDGAQHRHECCAAAGCSPEKRRRRLGCFRYRVDGRRSLVGGAVSNAGNLRAWCVRELRLDIDEAGLERALAARPAPRHGLTVEPLWSAERSPDWEEDSHGAIRGITQRTTALDILQAATEATYDPSCADRRTSCLRGWPRGRR